MRQRHRFGVLQIFLAITAVLYLPSCSDITPTTKTQFAMGAAVEICVADPISRQARVAAIDKAFARIKEIERLMSYYDSHSDVSSINNFADIRPVAVSDDTLKVLKRAGEINRITGGAFDITIAPLVDLWGFGAKGQPLPYPKQEEINQALFLVGVENLNIDYARKTVRFMHSGMKIDLSGIAAGYAVDCAVESLKESGIKNAMINAGGEVFCMGRQWKVGIQHPRDKRELLTSVYINDKAISTSGDYEKFFFHEKKRVSHIIDPRTGMPVSDVPASVSIIAPDCMTADALATAVFVMGPEKGMSVLKRMTSIEALIAVDQGDKLQVYKTDGFNR